MQFTKRLRDPIRNGEITQSVRVWKSARVKVGNSYSLTPGHILVEAIQQIGIEDINRKLARDTGFSSVAELLKIAKHGTGEKVFLITFRYVAPGETG